MKLQAYAGEPPLASLVVCEILKPNHNVNIEWNTKNILLLDDIAFNSDVSLCRYFARLFPKYSLYGSTLFQRLEIDHWLAFCIGPLRNNTIFLDNIAYLDTELSTVTYLVSDELTIADVCVWTFLYRSEKWNNLFGSKQFLNVHRWYSFIASCDFIRNCLAALTSNIKVNMNKSKQNNVANATSSAEKKEEGKFIELPGAEMGKVVVRFPPEASGYLHIGHAKAALLNQYYKDKFDGKLIMRFDDTNPAKEKVDFEKVILEDLEMLQVKPDLFTYTSNYFDLMLKYCEKLILEGKAYVDDTDPEVMKQDRDKKVESKHRNNSVDDNMKMWREMLQGADYGLRCCVRAKINMDSANGCLRDPTIYRCKLESHPKTGNKYKVYPTYDFACPIVDSIEGVTHCLRTTEYHDRDEQFYWFIDALGLRKPYIWEYSRLNMTNTVLSKRKLTWFVEEGYVDGWDDPRFPTVRGILRRGMTVAGLKQFIIAQGSSRSVVSMEWDKIWAFNKKVIDPIAPRYNALESIGTVPVLLENVKTEKVQVPKHPKNEDVGKKWVWKSNRVLIDSIDAEELKENENATFINWGNLLITKIHRSASKIISIEAKENLSNTDYKKTLKLTWLADIKEAPFVPCICVYFDHIITKPVLAKEEDFKNFINLNTKIERKMLGDPELVNVKKGDIIQLQRRGFYICDQEYKPPSIYTGCVSPIVLFFIPDGHSKETPITAQSKKEIIVKEVAKPNTKVENGPVKGEKKSGKKGKENNTNSSSNESNILRITDPQVLKEAEKLFESIKTQGDRIRQLKSEKREKNIIDDEVNTLLQLKKSFKNLANVEWKPGLSLEQLSGSNPSSLNVSQLSDPVTVEDLYDKVCRQASKVRFMQTEKIDKNIINTEVTVLTDLKEKYKTVAGESWSLKEGYDINIDDHFRKYVDELYSKIAAIENQILQLKEQKKDVDSQVKKISELKKEYKEATGSEFKPRANTTPSAVQQQVIESIKAMESKGREIHDKIVEQGNKIRQLKADKCSKEVIESEVKFLLELKQEFKEATNIIWTPKFNPDTDLNAHSTEKPAPKAEPKKSLNQPKQITLKSTVDVAAGNTKKQTRLGLEAKKSENLSEWYTQVITKSELIEYYDVSGCYTLRPWAFAIWKTIRSWFDQEITKLGVDECYFPIFVSKAALEKEKTHIADFAPEVAWVTKSGESDLEEPVAIRPTSETVMYPAYAKWIRSHRDLPLKLNQWNNVVRWEFKHPQPFLRTREFLWQEGHTAYASEEDAIKEVYEILDLYAKIYTDLLAIPVIKGRKTEKEKFAGGSFTTTVEAFVEASGRGIQGATSHHLGQNFSKMFEIVYEDPNTREKQFVYQNSWGITTRTIGVMVMIHADDQGLVLPPRVAKIQAVIVPCGISANTKAEDSASLDKSCLDLEATLRKAGVSVHYDSRDNYSPGWKFNHWELKGVPARIELGPKDIKQNQVVVVKRDTGEKLNLRRDNIDADVKKILDDIQQSLYKKAEEKLKNHIVILENWSTFVEKLNEKNLIMAPFCGETPCEDKIKQDSARNEGLDPGAPSMGAKSLCIPFEQPKDITSSSKCVHPECNNRPKFYTLFGRSY